MTKMGLSVLLLFWFGNAFQMAMNQTPAKKWPQNIALNVPKWTNQFGNQKICIFLNDLAGIFGPLKPLLLFLIDICALNVIEIIFIRNNWKKNKKEIFFCQEYPNLYKIYSFVFLTKWAKLNFSSLAIQLHSTSNNYHLFYHKFAQKLNWTVWIKFKTKWEISKEIREKLERLFF